MNTLARGCAAAMLAAIATTGCHRTAATPGPASGPASGSTHAAPRTVQPGAPGTSSHEVPSAQVASPKATDADVEFMQGMISHHAQAVQMVALLKTRTTNQDMQLLGLRIEVSQKDEIKTMQGWLRDHGADAPDPLAHQMHDMPGMDMPGMNMPMMPGMLTSEQMTQLAAAKGAEFDRVFLEFMIQHHEGALTMVKALMASPGAAQESKVFAFATDVVADQTAEINRMRGMRARMGK